MAYNSNQSVWHTYPRYHAHRETYADIKRREREAAQARKYKQSFVQIKRDYDLGKLTREQVSAKLVKELEKHYTIVRSADDNAATIYLETVYKNISQARLGPLVPAEYRVDYTITPERQKEINIYKGILPAFFYKVFILMTGCFVVVMALALTKDMGWITEVLGGLVAICAFPISVYIAFWKTPSAEEMGAELGTDVMGPPLRKPTPDMIPAFRKRMRVTKPVTTYQRPAPTPVAFSATSTTWAVSDD